jgi:hypothetical protein
MSLAKTQEFKKGDIDGRYREKVRGYNRRSAKSSQSIYRGVSDCSKRQQGFWCRQKPVKSATSIGSSTEVFGARPQNINITINGGLVAHQGNPYQNI